METLGERERRVLRAVVENHIHNPVPVASRTLSMLGFSPATIRHIMANLDEMGYITQPHTSAGRVPTNKGYRFYIAELMQARPLTSQERRTIDTGLSAADANSGNMLTAASRLLALSSHQAGLVLFPKLSSEPISRFHFVSIASRRIQVVLVGTLGRVRNVLVTLDEELTNAELAELANYINHRFSGKNLKQIRAALRRRVGTEEARADRLFEQTVKIQEQLGLDDQGLDLAVEGMEALFDIPEFQKDALKLKNLLKLLADKRRLLAILDRCMDEDAGQIVVEVGAEFKYNGGVEDCVFVAHSCGGTQQGWDGAIGVIGPTRMDYPYMLGLLDYFSKSLNGIMIGSKK